MTDISENTSEVPAIATYSEWIGFGADIPDHTRANIYAAMSSQGGDMDQIATSLHFHKSFGRWVFASAPLQGDTQ